MNERIGFIGLGIMGQGMVRNLLKAGFEVSIWNRTAKRMEPLKEAGAKKTDSPKDLASRCDVVITCVSDTPDVKEVVLGDKGVIHGVKSGALVVDMSTISPQATREIAAKLKEKGVHMLDAPISGGSEGATKGTLSIMIGGDATQVARAMPYFEAMGKTITHVGGHGALLFGQAGGLDLQKALEAVTQGAAGSWMLSNRGPQVLERDWRPGFTIDLQQKDLRLVLEAADQIGVPLMATNMVFNLYRTLQREGLGAEGNHALVKALERLSGIKISG
jgi:3-hydroxyisobutyrate dehydrogenase